MIRICFYVTVVTLYNYLLIQTTAVKGRARISVGDRKCKSAGHPGQLLTVSQKKRKPAQKLRLS